MDCLPFNKEGLKKAVAVLKKGGVISHPTDTCYGLAGDLMNPDALRKIQDIKGRKENKPMSMMIPAFMKDDIKKYAKLDEFSTFVCENLLPGPVTIVLPKGELIPKHFFPETPFVGIRMPYDIITEDILTAFGGPLITTSANISGSSPCATCKDCMETFKGKKNQPDILFKGAIKNACMPSTVIKIEDGKVRLLREGPMTKKQIEGILGMKIS
jgi:L-threonylcarbamoyladenylate synthase